MSNIVKITKLQDGPTDVIVHIHLESDGASGELVNQVIVDPATVVPLMSKGVSFNIRQLWYEISGFNCTLMFDSVNPFVIWTLTPGVDSVHDWRPFGGIKDATPSSDIPTGKIMISTDGFGAAGCKGTFVLTARKNK